MAGNETKITDIVGKEAFDQLERLDRKLADTQNVYIGLVKEIGKGLMINPSSLAELNAKIEEYKKNVSSLKSTIDTLNKTNDQYKRKIDELVEINKRYAEAAGKASSELEKSSKYTNTETSSIKSNISEKKKEISLSEDLQNLINNVVGKREDNIRRIAEETSILRDLSKQKKELDDQEKKGLMSMSESVNRRASLISEEIKHKQIKSQLEQAVRNETKAMLAAKDSLVEQKAELERLKAAYSNFTQEEKNSPLGSETQAAIDILRQAVREANQSMGDFHDDVGGYARGILEAIGLNGKFASSILNVATNSNSLKSALSVATTALSSFSKQLLALLANPIVAILAAVSMAIMGISKAIKSSEDATNRWNVIMAPLNRSLDFFLDLLQKGTGYILSFAEGAMSLANHLSEMAERLPLVGKYIKEMNAANREAVNLAKENADIVKQQRKDLVDNAKADKEVAELRKKSRDKENYTAKERLAFVERADKIEEESARRNLILAERKLKALQIQASFAENNAEVNDALAQAEANKYNAEKEYFNKTTELAGQKQEIINSINAENAQAAKARMEVERDIQRSIINTMKDGYNKQLAIINFNYDQQIIEANEKGVEVTRVIKSIEERREKDISALNRQYAERRAKEDAQNRIEAAREESLEELDARIDMLILQRDAELKAAKETGADKLLIEEKYAKMIQDLSLIHI